ncbi:LPP20 family lipoprotein [Helicobacter cappadocius]|uniref:Lipoprotein n=1 Tax=Helicobacter cappadocius TaxID=3063998 RepID=A0AA90PIQ5_9HELI|nr:MULTISPECIES: hypothetical protein [unclassified Helicobacter]MDO7253014.1 hypothetical protein [Helicobacter sp. faydin-H75]MDP2538997.1 hypothetical protein [Helicobacter sp. faydin-H76]
MTRRLFNNSAFLAVAVGLAGCNSMMNPSSDDTSLIPPSAVYQPGGIQAPVYPPTGFANPNLNAGNNIGSRRPAPEPLPDTRFDDSSDSIAAPKSDPMIQNTPVLTPSNVIELSAVGMGVAPESTISPSQALALAKRAAIVDAYRQLGEKMYGIRVNAQDTVRDMVLQNSTVKTKVQALIRNAEITETVYKDGLCQVSMELKLDGRVWYRALTGGRG